MKANFIIFQLAGITVLRQVEAGDGQLKSASPRVWYWHCCTPNTSEEKPRWALIV
jgi:hypothetical protein